MPTKHAFKVLSANRWTYFATVRWPEPGEWYEVEGKLVMCRNGLHLTYAKHLPTWARRRCSDVWLTEYDPEGGVIKGRAKFVVRKARLVRAVLNQEKLKVWARDISEEVRQDFIQNGGSRTGTYSDISAAKLRRAFSEQPTRWYEIRAITSYHGDDVLRSLAVTFQLLEESETYEVDWTILLDDLSLYMGDETAKRYYRRLIMAMGVRSFVAPSESWVC